MNRFDSAREMFAAMRANLNTRTFPDLLTHVVAAARPLLESEMASRAGRAPTVVADVSTVPAPGGAELRVTFVAGDEGGPEGTPGVYSISEAAAIKGAFERVYEDNLADKTRLLKLLASVGVT